MAIKITALVREFQYSGLILPDPNPALTPQEVLDVHSHTYPELGTAAIDGPVVRGEKHIYTFVRSVGTKG